MVPRASQAGGGGGFVSSSRGGGRRKEANLDFERKIPRVRDFSPAPLVFSEGAQRRPRPLLNGPSLVPMNILLDQQAIRPFSHAIACLTKIGKDVVIEATPSSLKLRTLNDSQSAYISVTFHQEFFMECNNYDLSSRSRKRQRTSSSSSSRQPGTNDDDDDDAATDQSDADDADGDYSFSSGAPKAASYKFACQTSLKAMHGILKRSRAALTLRISSSSPSSTSSTSTQSSSQVPQTSTQSSDAPASSGGPSSATQLVFDFRCLHGVRKVHRIGLQSTLDESIVEDPRDAQRCSSLTCCADALISLLEPVSKSAELVATFTEAECKAQSFDFDHLKGSKTLAERPVAPTADSLKTESSMAVEDFRSYEFLTDRVVGGGDRDAAGGGGGRRRHRRRRRR